jgi:hypothetical protein
MDNKSWTFGRVIKSIFRFAFEIVFAVVETSSPQKTSHRLGVSTHDADDALEEGRISSDEYIKIIEDK